MMKQQNTTNDPLKKLFGQLPEQQLPVDFRVSMMLKIKAEAERARKRNERLTFMWIVLASCLMIALGVLALMFIGIPQASLSMPEMPVISSSSAGSVLFIVFLSLLLLMGDYLMRRYYKKKHQE